MKSVFDLISLLTFWLIQPAGPLNTYGRALEMDYFRLKQYVKQLQSNVWFWIWLNRRLSAFDTEIVGFVWSPKWYDCNKFNNAFTNAILLTNNNNSLEFLDFLFIEEFVSSE